MQRTTARQMTDTALAARYVAHRVLGDLLSIHEKFRMNTETEMRNLAHDIESGLAYDCLNSLSLFLYPFGGYQPHRVYVYRRVAAGSFAPSPHSGRIDRSSLLVGGRLEYEVSLRNRETWHRLQQAGQLRIPWRSCYGRSTAGMSEQNDGGYTSGDLALSRTCLTWGGN